MRRNLPPRGLYFLHQLLSTVERKNLLNTPASRCAQDTRRILNASCRLWEADVGSSICSEEVREPSVKARGGGERETSCRAVLWLHTPGSLSSGNASNLQQIDLIGMERSSRSGSDLSESV